MKGFRYEQTFAAEGSQLHTALKEKKHKIAAQLYKQSTENFDKLYGAGARAWFENWRTA